MKNSVWKNLITSLLCEVAAMISGLIVPRLIITNFGSNVNGLVSSISQFLAFITLFEGGLGAVILAALYKPLESRDNKRVTEIVMSSKRFFRKIGIIFVIYTIILSVIYPLFINKEFPFEYTSTLILIISFGTMLQYFFSITNKLLLQASQKLYIVNIAMIATILINLVSVIIIIKAYPEIHIVKFASSTIYIIQPIIFKHYIQKLDIIDKNVVYVKNVLTNRWSGFVQNLTTYITMHTDVLVLTIFASLNDVSVYSVYLLALTSIRLILKSFSYSYHTVLGRLIAVGDVQKTTSVFQNYEKITWDSSSVLYSTCLLLIVPFVSLYTKDVHDTDYYAPMFGLIMVLSFFIYSARESQRLLVMAGGRFKQTNSGSVIEVILNLVISVVLVWNYGLIGVAIGTLVSVIYRLLYLLNYIENDNYLILNYNHFKALLPSIILFTINIIVFIILDTSFISSIFLFVVCGCILVILETGLLALMEIIFGNKKFVLDFLGYLRKQGRKIFS